MFVGRRRAPELSDDERARLCAELSLYHELENAAYIEGRSGATSRP